MCRLYVRAIVKIILVYGVRVREGSDGRKTEAAGLGKLGR